MEIVYFALIGLAMGFVKGLSGFGSSLVAITLLAILFGGNQFLVITPILITLNVFLNFLLMFENKAFSLSSLKSVWVITLFGIIFTFVGLYVLKQVHDLPIVTYIAAALIMLAIIVKLYQLFVNTPIKLKPNILLQAVVGSLSGIGNGIASIDGPPVVFYLSGVGADKKDFKNTLATHFLVMGLAGVVLLLVNQIYTINILVDTLKLGAFAVIGLFIGMYVSKRINERVFSYIVIIILFLLDIKMIFF